MTEAKMMSLEAIEEIAFKALLCAGASKKNARSMAVATAATEADGVASHGLAYIPIYCEHVQCAKVDGKAVPEIAQVRPGMLMVDAKTGFAHPAIDLGFERLIPLAREQGISSLMIKNSYNCGILGYHTNRLAEAGLVGIGFTNAPASIAPSGGSKPVLGTNPFSIAVPGLHGEVAILIDQSASAIAKSEVMKYAREEKAIPLGWALGPDGKPTTDPEQGLKGSMAPSGGYKGVGIALCVEIMAAALSGARLGIDASPFSGNAGGPPGTGQFFIAIDPAASDGFDARIARLAAAFHAEAAAHLPGDGRKAKRAAARGEGVAVNLETYKKIQSIVT